MKYCMDCGALLARRDVEGRPRAVCPSCGRIHYRQLKVGAGGWVEQGGRLLLVQRAIAPFEGCWNLPAGYVEADEHPREAAIREIREETALQVEADRLVDVYFFDDDPRGNGILIVYACHVVAGALADSPEGVHAAFFGRNEIPANLAGGGHDQAIRAWMEHGEASRQ